MKNSLTTIFLLLFLNSCTSNPAQSEPEGEYKFQPVVNFFSDDIQKSELSLKLRQSTLQCENELMQIDFSEKKKTPKKNNSNSSYLDAFQSGINIANAANSPRVIAEKKRKYFNNCMELNGFIKVWVPLKDIEE